MFGTRSALQALSASIALFTGMAGMAAVVATMFIGVLASCMVQGFILMKSLLDLEFLCS